MTPGLDVIIVAWVDMDGGRERTGRRVLHNSTWIDEMRPAPAPMAVVWSRDPADLPGAAEYATKNGCRVLVLRDTDDVLDRARAMVLVKPYQPDTTCYQTEIQKLLVKYGEVGQ